MTMQARQIDEAAIGVVVYGSITVVALLIDQHAPIEDLWRQAPSLFGSVFVVAVA